MKTHHWVCHVAAQAILFLKRANTKRTMDTVHRDRPNVADGMMAESCGVVDLPQGLTT
jgi:hypothetical protein